MKLKILLLSPPLFDFYFTVHRCEPLGLLYIREALSQYDFLEVDVFDARISATTKVIPTPEIFSYLDHIYVHDTSWFRLLHRFKRFGYSFDRIVALIQQHRYDVVCITSMFTAYHYDVELLVQKIKQQTDAIVIIGGWAVWAQEEIANKGNADIYIQGDGEIVLPDILSQIYATRNCNTIPKLVAENRIVANTFFIHQFPRRIHTYMYYGKKIANVIWSKGCIYNCSFCTIHARYRFLQRSLKSIEKELEYLYQNGIQIVNIEDDNLFYNRTYALQLLSLLKYYHKKGMKFLCMNGITASNILDLIDEIIEAGFLELNLSLVSSHDSVVMRFNRPVTKEMIEYIAAKCCNKIKVVIFIIAGLPGSKVDDCIEDILFLARLPVIIGFSPLYCIPRTELFAHHDLPDLRLCRGSALYWFGEHFTREDIAVLWKLCRFINTLKSQSFSRSEYWQHVTMYKRICRDKVAYYRDDKYAWHEGFTFAADVPESFEYADLQGFIHTI